MAEEASAFPSTSLHPPSPSSSTNLTFPQPSPSSSLPHTQPPPTCKRPFCQRCRKAQSLCICSRFRGVVQNRTVVTILQHPQESDHPIGSARIALLGLRNVALVAAPEVDPGVSHRFRPKVPGSKRSVAGRGGKKVATQYAVSKRKGERSIDLGDLDFGKCLRHVSEGHKIGCVSKQQNVEQSERSGDWESEEISGNSISADRECVPRFSFMQFSINVPFGVALLYPSDKAIDLTLSECPSSQPTLCCQNEGEHQSAHLPEPSHLIVLDGTWSKAKRIYFQNPWLQVLPHYKLPATTRSLYQGVRRQPKPGCLSTLESIVYALQLLEPETEGLDVLLQVFDSMVEDQRRCKEQRLLAPERSSSG